MHKTTNNNRRKTKMNKRRKTNVNNGKKRRRVYTRKMRGGSTTFDVILYVEHNPQGNGVVIIRNQRNRAVETFLFRFSYNIVNNTWNQTQSEFFLNWEENSDIGYPMGYRLADPDTDRLTPPNGTPNVLCNPRITGFSHPDVQASLLSRLNRLAHPINGTAIILASGLMNPDLIMP